VTPAVLRIDRLRVFEMNSMVTERAVLTNPSLFEPAKACTILAVPRCDTILGGCAAMEAVSCLRVASRETDHT